MGGGFRPARGSGALLLAMLAAPAQAQHPPIAAMPSPALPPIVAVPSTPQPPIYVPTETVRLTPPLAPSQRIIRPPLERRPAQSLVGIDDYPASALARREEGRVAFALEIGPNGRVVGCTITRSSGSSALDSTTCRLMRSRARFTPAMDSTGGPAAGVVEQEVDWRLPPR